MFKSTINSIKFVNIMITGIILAAGTSSRYQGEMPKQFSLFNNRMIIDYSITTFSNHDSIDDIIIVVSEKYYQMIKDKYPDFHVIIGGQKRQESSLIGLLSCNKKTKNVLIHDAARAMVSETIITRCLNALKNYDGVAPALPSINTLASIDSNKNIIEIPSREHHYELQTPQCFNYKILLDSYNKLNSNVTDDISVLIKMGYKCTIVKGERLNMKITTQEDIKILSQIDE